MSVKRLATVAAAVLLAVTTVSVPAQAAGTWQCQEGSRYWLGGTRYNIKGRPCTGSGTENVSVHIRFGAIWDSFRCPRVTYLPADQRIEALSCTLLP
ncbi:hypothetical protein [Nonomuraea typhae]|uniref:hypothetical protein n=1 Tax=Nonomuraea typhae TaxID=2603600 RepID=UPI0012FA0E03|nr:hypothetical protein [Nonomuraea typhae]